LKFPKWRLLCKEQEVAAKIKKRKGIFAPAAASQHHQKGRNVKIAKEESRWQNT